MAKNLFISNFKKIPGAFIIAVMLLLLTNYLLLLVQEDAPYSNLNLHKLNKQKETSVLVLGNSRVKSSVVLPIVEDNLFGEGKNKILLLSVYGGMPKGYLHTIKRVLDKACTSGGTLVLGVSPYELNKYAFSTQSFYVITFFTWKDLFSDLIPNRRWNEMKIYFFHYFSPLRNVRPILAQVAYNVVPWFDRCDEKAKTKINRDIVNAELTNAALKQYEEKLVINYTIDSYQIESIENIVKICDKKSIKVVILLLPLSSDLRQVLGRDPLNLFIETIYSVAANKKCFVLDYISSYSGNEYTYYDASHMVSESAREFSRKLASDLKQIIER